jgi:hypothetical protein
MAARHLVVPLIILCGVGGGLLLIAATFITENATMLTVPYLTVLSAAVFYLRYQAHFHASLRQFFLVLFCVFTLMSVLFYAYASLVELEYFLALPFWDNLLGFLLVSFTAAVSALLVSLFRKKRALSVGK